jgi:hypothetical protein
MHHVVGLALLLQLQAPAEPTPAPSTPAPSTPTETVATPTTPPPAAEKKSLLPPKTKPRLLVMDLQDKGAGAEITNAINQAMQGQAINSHTGESVTATQIKLLLDAQSQQQLVGCDSELCMTDLGKAIEADLILGGNVAKVADDVVITLLTVNPVDGKRVKQEQRKTPLNKDLYFYAAQQQTAFILTGKATDSRVPAVFTFKNKDNGDVNATLIVDGQVVATATNAKLELDPGQHEVIVQAPDYADWKSMVDVQAGQPVIVNATLLGTRTYLWPGAVATGTVAAALGVATFVVFDLAAAQFNGSQLLPVWTRKEKDTEVAYSADNKNTYAAVSPTNSADLCLREKDISFLVGRQARGNEAGGAANECGIANGPGLAHWLGGGAGALGIITVALITTDVVLSATAE